MLNEHQWRLGHRRPWWQWNVVTLFVSLFVLIWVRELLSLSKVEGWFFGVAVIVLWAVLPRLRQMLISDGSTVGTDREPLWRSLRKMQIRLRARFRHWPKATRYVALFAFFLLLSLVVFGAISF